MNKIIANEIASLYKFHEFDISPGKLKRLAEIIYQMNPNANEKIIKEFFRFAEQGQYGMLYKNPTCLTTMYNTYRKDNKRPHYFRHFDDEKPSLSKEQMPDSLKKKFGIK